MTAISKHGRFAPGRGFAYIAERIRLVSEGIAKALQRRYRAKAIVAELEAYTERELADLGISRHDIRRIARQSVTNA